MAEIRATLDSVGWAILAKLKREEALCSAQIALNVAGDDEEKRVHRALYHNLMSIVLFKGMFDSELSSTQAIPAEQLPNNILPVVDDGSIP